MTSKFLCDGYVIENTPSNLKALIINAILCDGYVIGKQILCGGYLIEQKL